MHVAQTEERAAFQLERMILFSDAVFAIAITLLIIEIKVPELHGPEANELALLYAIRNLIPKFLGFLISFILVGMYWTVHHRMFGYVAGITPKLMRLNLLFLFTIVLMPFSTGLFGEYSRPSAIHLKTPFVIYVLNVSFTGIATFFLWAYIGNPSNGVADPSLDATTVRRAKTRALLIPTIFSLAIPVAFLNPYLARYVPVLLPVALRVVNRRARVPLRS